MEKLYNMIVTVNEETGGVDMVTPTIPQIKPLLSVRMRRS